MGNLKCLGVLGLENRGDEVRDRVTQILLNYHANPILLGRRFSS